MSITYTENVSTEIRLVLTRKRLRQWELAVALGWSQVRLSRRMSGKVAWSTDDLAQVAEALGLPIGQLVTPGPAIEPAADLCYCMPGANPHPYHGTPRP